MTGIKKGHVHKNRHFRRSFCQVPDRMRVGIQQDFLDGGWHLITMDRMSDILADPCEEYLEDSVGAQNFEVIKSERTRPQKSYEKLYERVSKPGYYTYKTPCVAFRHKIDAIEFKLRFL